MMIYLLFLVIAILVIGVVILMERTFCALSNRFQIRTVFLSVETIYRLSGVVKILLVI